MKTQFGQRLRAEMDLQGITTKDLGQKSGVNYRTIEGWLSDRGIMPRADDALSVAQSLGSTVEFLFAVSPQKDPQLIKLETRVYHFIKTLDQVKDEEISSIIQELIELLSLLIKKVSQRP